MYEIPQQLEYKEKIVFGLTFQQLAYAFLFFPIIFILLFKISAPLSMKIILALFPVSLAVGFMFFNLSTLIKNWYTWFKLNDLNTKEKLSQALPLGTVSNNLIHHNNKKIAVLKVNSINFAMKHKEEKEVIALAFQKFLNSIDFPLQILMTTETLSLNEYLSSIERLGLSESHSKIFDSYKDHMKHLVENNSAMNRNFYVVIPETSDINIQVKLCEERLHSLDLLSFRLEDDSLRKIFSKVFQLNEEHILPHRIENFPSHLVIHEMKTQKELNDEFEQEIINEIIGKLEDFDVIIDEEILVETIFLKEYIEDNQEKPLKYQKVLYAHGYPRSVENGFLDKLVSCSGNFDFSIHINPYPIEQMIVRLNKELQKQRADLYAVKIKNQLSPSLEIKYQDTRNTLERLQKGDEKLFDVSLYINCRANNEDALTLLTRKLESQLNSLLIIPKKPNFRMIDGIKSCQPLAKNYLGIKRNITTTALSAFFPFTSSFQKFDKSGVWLGIDSNNIPIIRDIFSLSNPNGIVLAQSGGGKSYFSKLLITRYLLNGTKVMVIDPQGEYKSLVSHFKGQRIDLSRDSDTIINPLDLMGHNYFEKRLSLIDLMKIMIGELTDIQKAFLDKALNETYNKSGITKNPDTWNNEPPILGDLMKVFKEMEKKASKLEQSTINSLSSRLEMYVNGVFGFFNRKTNLNFNNNLVCFDIGNLPSQVKPSIMFLVLDYIYMKMKSDLDRKILLIDEAWMLLSRSEEAGYIFQIVKTCRKFNLGLLLINQEVEGLLDSKAGKSVLANSAYTVLMKQKASVIDNIQKTFHLSEQERNYLLTANIGEGLLMMEDDHSLIKVIASPEEHKLITTNPDELNSLKKEKKKDEEQKEVSITVDPNGRYFRRNKLSKDEAKYLLDEGYQLKKYKCLLTDKMEEFLLQPRHNESLTHLFMIHNISEYLEKHGIKTELFTTAKPDIVFSIKDRNYAIEVETGSMLSRKKALKERITQLNKDYDHWFFVVTDPNKIKEYLKMADAVSSRYVKPRLTKIIKVVKSL
ncbi:MAG: DUF87 domain-containing protein [Nanoarchaeota archaeon]